MDAMIEKVLAEITTSVSQVSTESLTQAGALIESASRIFVSGAGRSGLCMRAFGMRLMQLSKIVYIVGETTTPSITAGDLLILGSGSGQTDTLLVIAEKARKQDVKILLFTTNWTSPLAELADHLVLIPAPSFTLIQTQCTFTSVQPLGALFEQSILILSDYLIMQLMQSKGIGSEQMLERHANLE